jgi:hypothetical protein
MKEKGLGVQDKRGGSGSNTTVGTIVGSGMVGAGGQSRRAFSVIQFHGMVLGFRTESLCSRMVLDPTIASSKPACV